MKIFISYRRDDSAGYAGRLFDYLSAHFGSNNVFMDIDTIEPGEDFRKVVSRAVGTCDVVLVMIGKQWLSITDTQGRRRLDDPRDWVRMEITSALANRRIRVIPVLVRDAAVPSEHELPEGLKELTWRNAMELSDSRFQHDVRKLIGVIERLAVRTSPETPLPVQKPVSRPGPPHTRNVLLFAGLPVLAALAFFIWKFSNGSVGTTARATATAVAANTNAAAFTTPLLTALPPTWTITVPPTDTSTPEPSPTATQPEVTGYLVQLVDDYYRCINTAVHDHRDDYVLCWNMLSDRPDEFQDYLNQNSGGQNAFINSWNRVKVSYALYYCYEDGQHVVYAEYYYHPWDNLSQISGGQNFLAYHFALDAEGWRIAGAFIRNRLSQSCESQPRVNQLSLFQ